MEQLLTDMGLRIAELRRQKRMTQEELAECAGMTSQTMSTAELGKKALRPENIVKLSRALQVSADYLLTGCRNEINHTLINAKLENISAERYKRYIRIMRVVDIMLED